MYGDFMHRLCVVLSVVEVYNLDISGEWLNSSLCEKVRIETFVTRVFSISTKDPSPQL